MVIWRERSFTEGELYANLTLRTARRADELESADSGRVIRVGQVLERDPKGTN